MGTDFVGSSDVNGSSIYQVPTSHDSSPILLSSFPFPNIGRKEDGEATEEDIVIPYAQICRPSCVIIFLCIYKYDFIVQKNKYGKT